MPRPAAAVTTSILLAIFTLFCFHYSSRAAGSTAMSPAIPDPDDSPPQSPPNPNIPISVEISALPVPTFGHETPAKSTSSVNIHLTVTNTSPSHSLFLLLWSSPISTLAPAQGIFSLTSVKTGQIAPCLNLMPNRKVPASQSFSRDSQHIVRIEAGGVLERDVMIKAPEVKIQPGEEYEIVAKGQWMGVWVEIMDEDQKDEELSLKEGGGIQRGGFTSNVLMVKAS